MKRCPTCRRDYHDDTLNFCLDDGASLLPGPASAEQQTMILPDAGFTAQSLFGSQFGQASAPYFGLPKLSQLTFSEAIEQYPAWSPNNKDLAFSREESGIRKIFIKDL